QAVSIAPSTTLKAAQFGSLTPSTPNSLPYASIAGLITEAALIDTAIGAAASGIAEASLVADLELWLEGGAAKLYGQPTGVPPSPIAVNVWPGANAWYSLLLLWDADFHPLLAPATADYP